MRGNVVGPGIVVLGLITPSGGPVNVGWVAPHGPSTGQTEPRAMKARSSDGTQSVSHGVWVRVGDRKFLSTIYVFAYSESRVLTTITKVRSNLQMSLDGQTMKGTNEVVVMDRTGKVLANIPGGTVSSVRLSPEIPGDFYDFQKVQ